MSIWIVGLLVSIALIALCWGMIGVSLLCDSLRHNRNGHKTL